MATPPATARLANRERILRAILRAGPLARVDLAQRTGLTTAAISNITRELIDDRLLGEVGTARGNRVGASAILLDLPDDGVVLGVVHQGVSALRVGLCTLRGRVVARRVIPTAGRYAPEWAVDAIAATITELLAAQGLPATALVGVSLGIIGLVDSARGIARRTHSLGWHNVPLGALLEARLGRRVAVENNVRAMAIGEALLGAGRDQPDFAFVYIGTGIGAGLIIDGKPYRGAYGGAGELGHITVDPQGEQCACGNRGCLEVTAAEPAIVRHARQAGLALADAPKDAMRDLVALAGAGDAAALATVAAAGESLGVALADLVDLLNPSRIVLHGVIVGAGAPFFAAVGRALHQRAFLAAEDTVPLVPATFGEDAGLVGAAAVALDALIFDQGGSLAVPPESLLEGALHAE